MEAIIKIKNLNVTYFPGQDNEVRALRDINLEIFPGEFVVFFGPSGCGKSTLLYSIAGLENQTKGEILVNNKNIAMMKTRELEYYHQKTTGMIFQAFYLINSLSVRKNIALPQIALSVPKKERKQRAEELMQHFGVKEQMHKLPNELSGGQQQRVCICRALINDPDILFADEPVGNLDSKSAEDVLVLLKALNTEQKKTIILVTHNPAHVNLAHRVFYIKDGSIIETKVNEKISNEIPKEKEIETRPTISKDLELLARSFSNITGTAGNLLIPFKAKEIVSEVLTGFTAEDISRIERKVEGLLIAGMQDGSLFKFLDDEVEKGGLGMDKRVARNLAEQIKAIIVEIKSLQEQEKQILENTGFDIKKEAKEIRENTFKTLAIKISDEATLNIVDKLIILRLENKIDENILFKKLDLPTNKNGAGLNKQVARKLAKRIELLILGKLK